ncbi:MAG: RNA methyltransferase [Bacteroidetes bacterium]|jgi:TrmH family RNA methyltransferase|nr:RNA methyltransferase [Bacteroidota bacterium]
MITKQQLKLIQSLQHKKYRKLHGLFLVEGTKMVQELILSDLSIEHLIVTDPWQRDNPHFDFNGVLPEVLAEHSYKPLSKLTTPPGILAVARIPEDNFKALWLQEVVLCLDGINDPGNMGTIIRTAEWFGIRELICSQDCADVWQPKTVQASMGSVFRMQIHTTELSVFLKEVGTRHIPVYGALLEGSDVFQQVFSPESTAVLLIGSESHGINKTLLPLITNPLTIPAHALSKAESLNASVAAAIFLSCLCRKQ